MMGKNIKTQVRSVPRIHIGTWYIAHIYRRYGGKGKGRGRVGVLYNNGNGEYESISIKIKIN